MTVVAISPQELLAQVAQKIWELKPHLEEVQEQLLRAIRESNLYSQRLSELDADLKALVLKEKDIRALSVDLAGRVRVCLQRQRWSSSLPRSSTLETLNREIIPVKVEHRIVFEQIEGLKDLTKQTGALLQETDVRVKELGAQLTDLNRSIRLLNGLKARCKCHSIGDGGPLPTRQETLRGIQREFLSLENTRGYK